MRPHPYSDLQIAPLRATAEQLSRRIAERFPGSGLSRVGAELVALVEETEAELEHLRRPLWGLRGVVALAIVSVLATAVWAAMQVTRLAGGEAVGAAEMLQGLDAAINELIFLGLVLLFFTSLETRAKRRRALRALHRLRSLAHVVDMHQLTKDPEYAARGARPTASSPRRSLSRFELARYLDYCSELLALIGKLAAVHAPLLPDPVVLDAVKDIEALTLGLSGKIWQKITILDSVTEESGSTPAAPPLPGPPPA